MRSTASITAGSRTTPPLPTCSAPASNCGLTSATIQASGAISRRSAGSTQPQRDKRHIDRRAIRQDCRVVSCRVVSSCPLSVVRVQLTMKNRQRRQRFLVSVLGSGSGSAGRGRRTFFFFSFFVGRQRLQIPDIGPLEHDHARILAQPPVEQPIADIDGVDARRAALEQHIGEPAGRGAHIDRDQPIRREAKAVERVGQLVAAAAGVGQRGGDLDIGVGQHHIAGLGASTPPTRTEPARISAWAFVRVSARPRWTSS